MIGAASLTPTQEAIMNRHREFRAKIAARAVPDAGFSLKRQPAKPIAVPIPDEPMARFSRTMDLLPAIVKRFSVSSPAPDAAKAEPAPPAGLPRGPTIAEIQIATAKQFGLSRMDILSERRTADITHPRQVAMYLCRQLTLRSLPEIGRRFGGRDHTTVLHGASKIARLLQAGAINLDFDIEAIKSNLPMVSA